MNMYIYVLFIVVANALWDHKIVQQVIAWYRDRCWQSSVYTVVRPARHWSLCSLAPLELHRGPVKHQALFLGRNLASSVARF
jgi:hypothetical protein